VSREQARLRLRQLDACLERLEVAHERGDMAVPLSLALVVGRYVPVVRPGMPITQAIKLVMRAQEPHLARDSADPFNGEGTVVRSTTPRRTPESVEPARPTATVDRPVSEIDGPGARELTDRIRRASETAGRVCSLLVEAHQRRAWSALGYHTWADYVRLEFRLSRSRSYELLDQGRVIRAMEAVTGLSGIPDISPYAAAQIKAHIAEITETLRARIAGLSPESIAKVADQIVREVRSRASAERRTPGPFGMPPAVPVGPVDLATASRPQTAAPASHGVDLERLYEALRTLATMPSVTDILTLIPTGHVDHLASLAQAQRWLSEFARACGGAIR
jgi:hypothetical protein